MPGIKETENQKISGAITYPTQETSQNGHNSNNLPQPRQPTNLQGLLRFAMDTTRNEDAPGDAQSLPMDGERRQFLEEALKSMSVDVIEILQKQIKILQNAGNIGLQDDIAEYEDAFENILEYIDSMDIANDFHKIGGFTIFNPCIKSVHPLIRASACNILAELCQNNPYCQRVALDNSFLPLILNLLDQDEDDKVCVKALYALSCIARENQEGFNQLVQHGGLTILLKTLKKTEDKLRTKTTFLLGALCRTQLDLKSRLVFLEYVPALISILAEERQPSHEHVLSLLLTLVEENQTAQNECKNPQHNFKETLQNYLAIIKNKDEALEEEQYCRRLLRLLQYG